ncbi:hypothetical protein E5K00_07100 [Hymenobacter aquaticus]|uniref:ATPase AAA-type core domain-containing protein n=1 Tax=Hymenobacter aquaticus TaxID=1867101 RepID=A0A4Z0Q4I5_9BACT|nr:hypothetical protein E5K00_07100 [Hymenobacter aquaticus]
MSGKNARGPADTGRPVIFGAGPLLVPSVVTFRAMSKQPATPPPAYFLSLSLENVRSFGEKQTISFAREDGRPAQWTIILGDNGVGKTTVLKALAALRPIKTGFSDEDHLMPAYMEMNVSRWKPIRHSGEGTTIMSCITHIGSKLADVSHSVVGTYSVMIPSPEAQKRDKYIIHIPVVDSENAELKCYGYGAGRTTGTTTLGASESPAEDNCSSLFDDRADLLNPEEWFLQKMLSSYVNQGGAKSALVQIESVRQALLQVLPDVADIQIKSNKQQQQQLELLTPYGWVRLRDMSLGYQTLVVWLTDFASKLFIRYPDSPNPLEMPAIVLIDEIDLHLHPSWQRKLIGFLSGIFKNTQFIATAHSPLVVQAAGDANANVVLLKREGDQTVVVQDLEDVRGWRIDQIMTSELFGLETARSRETEAKMVERAGLLSKARLTAAEKKRLQELTQELDQQPLGETPSEREVHDVLQQLRQKLGRNPSDAPAR